MQGSGVGSTGRAVEAPVGEVVVEPGMSLATAAYNALRDAILRGYLRPNQRVVETQLAEWMNLSRTPVREALARLANEGLVFSERRGWTVRDYSPQEVSEIHEVRAALEGMAAYLACERGSEEEIGRIVGFHRDQDRERLTMAASEYLVEYNETFHQVIVAAAGNERLAELNRRNREFFFTYRIARLFTEDDAKVSVAGHDKIVEAIEARDGERAELEMRRHILGARDVIIRKLY
jgi:DNA-binding GntR family transcriptional regulator